jgi:general nucleoside transport system permease protein
MLEQMLTITFITGILAATIRMATPILITALGEMISERAGILNLGIEGIMIVGAFFGFWISFISGNLWLGLLSGGLAGALFGLIMGIASIRYRANQIVTGLGIWILCSGLSSFLNRRVFGIGSDNRHIVTLEPVRIPFLSEIPIVGETLFNQNIIVYLAILLIPLSAYLLKKTSWGLNINAAGENPRAADAAGVNVSMVRYLAVIYGGMMAGLGGAYLPIAFYGLYTDDLSMGRGWMAIAVVVFGRWAPWGILGGSLIFGAASALQYRLQALNFPLPYQFILMLPYVVTLIFVILFVKGETGPSALARPYNRNEAD